MINKKKYDVLTALDLCVDFIMDLGDTVPEFGQKEKLVDGYSLELGGSTAIFASQASKLGLKTAGIGKIGDDIFGDLVTDKLKIAGVDTNYIKKDAGIKTGVGVALCSKSDRAILTYTGSIDAVSPTDYSFSLIESTRHIHIGSYYLMKTLQPAYPEIVRLARQNGVTISLDTNWDPNEKWDSGIMEILPFVDIFFSNENEAMGIAKSKTPDEAMQIFAEIIPMVIIKKGAAGAMAIYNGEFINSAALSVQVIDTVGAGDSFDAGFVYGFLTGCQMQKCLDIACTCGSLSTQKPGGVAAQPNLSMLNRLLSE